jgi:hypothetical protein
MKSRSIRVALLSAFVLTSPVLTFAAGQPKLRVPSKSETQDLSGATRALQQGKGAGMSRIQVATPGPNADRLRANWGDSALRK